MERPRTVLIVDDAEEMRILARAYLLHSDRFKVVGEASNGADAIAKASELKPDFVLLDYMMPLLDGERAAPYLKQVSPDTCVVAFTNVLGTRPRWADGYLDKRHLKDLPDLLERLDATRRPSRR